MRSPKEIDLNEIVEGSLKMLRRHPKLKRLFMSGFPANAIAHTPVGRARLPKCSPIRVKYGRLSNPRTLDHTVVPP